VCFWAGVLFLQSNKVKKEFSEVKTRITLSVLSGKLKNSYNEYH
jgi:hypothetical protein